MEYTVTSDNRFLASLEYLRGKSNFAESLADVIVTDCKSFYINEKIRLPIQDPILRHAFICALITFDHDTDKVIAKTILEDFLTKNRTVRLDGVYDFMLDVLKSRWDEVCNLANENIHYLICQKTFMELLQFLISNIDCQMDETIFMHIREAAIREDVKKFFGSCVASN